MKYKFEIVIQLEQTKLIDLALDRPALLKWQSGLLDVELASGTPGEQEVKYNLTMGKKSKPLVIPETIILINRPFEYRAEYLFDDITSFCKTQFLKIDANSTKYITEFELKFPVVLINWFIWLATPITKWQTKKFLNRFKKIAEKSNVNAVL